MSFLPPTNSPPAPGVTFAGTAINLCLGILYAWSVWKEKLIGTAEHPAGTAMTGLNEGWIYLNKAEATWAYSICGFVFALFMIAGGRLQDRYGPKIGATSGGLFFAGGGRFFRARESEPRFVFLLARPGGPGPGGGHRAPPPPPPP